MIRHKSQLVMMSYHQSQSVINGHHESWWVIISHDESPWVMMNHHGPWWVTISHDEFRRVTMRVRWIVCFYPSRSSAFSLKIVRFRPGSSALTQRSSALTLKDRPLWQKIVCFGSDRLLWPMDRLLSTWIVCFDPFQDRLLWPWRIVCFRPYSLSFISADDIQVRYYSLVKFFC